MSNYLDSGIYKDHPYPPSHIVNNDSEDEKVFKFCFQENKNNDEEFSNKDEVYLMNSTKSKTNNAGQDEFNNLNTNNNKIINNDNKEKNDNQNKNKINEEDKNAPKLKKELFNINKMPPTLCTIDNILKTKEKQLGEPIKEIFKKIQDSLLDLEIKMNNTTFLGPKKRNRDKSKESTEPRVLGRKTLKFQKDENIKYHDKYSLDNISTKIKTILINGFLLIFINSAFNSFLTPDNKKLYLRKAKGKKENEEIEDEDLIKKLDYNKMVKEKKDENLKDLHMPLKDILSKDNSSNRKIYPKDANKIVIDEIIEKEKNNKIIMFILKDLTLGDYIDLFLYKKELKDFGKLDEEKINQINNILKRIDVLFEKKDSLKNEKIKKIVNKFATFIDDNKYISKFIFIFYNYERFFFIKQHREKRNNEEKKDNEEKKILKKKKIKMNKKK